MSCAHECDNTGACEWDNNNGTTPLQCADCEMPWPGVQLPVPHPAQRYSGWGEQELDWRDRASEAIAGAGRTLDREGPFT